MKITKTPYIFGILIFIILIPVLSYTVFQFNRLSDTELLITEIYERQLNGILFSLNQHSWDVMSRVATEIKNSLATREKEPEDLPDFSDLFQRNPFLTGLAFRFRPNQFALTGSETLLQPVEKQIRELLNSNAPHVARLEKQAKKNYEKLESFSLQTTGVPLTLQLFTFSPSVESEEMWLCGMIIDDNRFGREILSRKINEIQSEEFIFGVRHRNSGEIIFASQPLPDLHFEHAKAFWLFPGLDLVVRSTGPTISEIARSRTRTNLIFLVTMNLILLTGLGILLKTISSQMQLAKMKSDFVSNVSHELRTPLALIRMFAETLEMGRFHPKPKKDATTRLLPLKVTA